MKINREQLKESLLKQWKGVVKGYFEIREEIPLEIELLYEGNNGLEYRSVFEFTVDNLGETLQDHWPNMVTLISRSIAQDMILAAMESDTDVSLEDVENEDEFHLLSGQDGFLKQKCKQGVVLLNSLQVNFDVGGLNITVRVLYKAEFKCQ